MGRQGETLGLYLGLDSTVDNAAALRQKSVTKPNDRRYEGYGSLASCSVFFTHERTRAFTLGSGVGWVYFMVSNHGIHT